MYRLGVAVVHTSKRGEPAFRFPERCNFLLTPTRADVRAQLDGGVGFGLEIMRTAAQAMLLFSIGHPDRLLIDGNQKLAYASY